MGRQDSYQFHSGRNIIISLMIFLIQGLWFIHLPVEILSVEADFLQGVLMMMLHDKKHFLSYKAVSASDDKCASMSQVITCGTWHLR